MPESTAATDFTGLLVYGCAIYGYLFPILISQLPRPAPPDANDFVDVRFGSKKCTLTYSWKETERLLRGLYPFGGLFDLSKLFTRCLVLL